MREDKMEKATELTDEEAANVVGGDGVELAKRELKCPRCYFKFNETKSTGFTGICPKYKQDVFAPVVKEPEPELPPSLPTQLTPGIPSGQVKKPLIIPNSNNR